MNQDNSYSLSTNDSLIYNQYLLKKLVSTKKENLSTEELKSMITNILNGNCSEIFISAFLVSLTLKGETYEEMKSSMEVIQDHSIRISPHVDIPILDNCGTGGDLLNTINISTASAVIASSYKKIALAKHGNRSSSSLCGSADFFESIGYNLNNSTIIIQDSIEKLGFGFVFAPLFHPGLRNASHVRRELGIKTIFNKIGPLCNPCTNLYGQIIGVSDPSLLEVMSKLIPLIGLKKAMIVYSHDGMDELSTTGKNTVYFVSHLHNNYVVEKKIMDPQDFGLDKSSIDKITVKSKLDSVVETLKVIYGMQKNRSMEDIVLLNTASILYTGDIVTSIKEGISLSRDLINEGLPQKTIQSMIKNYGDISKLESIEKLF